MNKKLFSKSYSTANFAILTKYNNSHLSVEALFVWQVSMFKQSFEAQEG